jgi:hypothetical protein
MFSRATGPLLAVAFALAAGPAGADGSDTYRRHWYPGYDLRLPPERHVIEVVDGWGRFIINGRPFAPVTPECHWLAGERIEFRAGDMNGRCRTAVIYNFRWRQACEVACSGWLNVW